MLLHAAFSKDRTRPSGLQAICRDCGRKQAQTPSNRLKAREKKLRQHYGLTIQDFDEMLEAQGGCCGICEANEPGGKGRFHVDHNHQTDEVRALLCSCCNLGLGQLRDSPQLMQSAINYLRFHTESVTEHTQHEYSNLEGAQQRRLATNLKHKYGLTLLAFDEMLEAQNGCCAICATDEPGHWCGRFCIDHNHLTGQVRALLCNGCNSGLGQFKDDITALQSAINYLHKHEATDE